ncbi:hypothetical protein [Staphylococcus phage vB_SauM-V1SA22]|nr:hypothetical protein [Staphylococcus phage vB_SauM-V1SA19]UVD42701.1 hypothetical protein [Staphylococcus phage vB_SauM-V1SA22]
MSTLLITNCIHFTIKLVICFLTLLHLIRVLVYYDI